MQHIVQIIHWFIRMVFDVNQHLGIILICDSELLFWMIQPKPTGFCYFNDVIYEEHTICFCFESRCFIYIRKRKVDAVPPEEVFAEKGRFIFQPSVAHNLMTNSKALQWGYGIWVVVHSILTKWRWFCWEGILERDVSLAINIVFKSFFERPQGQPFMPGSTLMPGHV